MVLGIEGVRRVLGHFAEEAGVSAFAPLAYTLLLQVQTTICSMSPEISGAAARALVDLVRMPPSSRLFDVSGAFSSDSTLPISPEVASSSIWHLGWSVLWRLGQFF